MEKIKFGAEGFSCVDEQCRVMKRKEVGIEAEMGVAVMGGWAGGWLGIGMAKWQKAQELAQTVWSVSQLSPSLSNFGEISQPHVFFHQ